MIRTAEISFDISLIEKIATDFDLTLGILEEGMRKALEVIQGEIVKRIPTGATGNAGRSTQIRTARRPGEISGFVFSDSPYMQQIEDGRGAGKFPPFGIGSPIFDWVKYHVNAVGDMSLNGMSMESLAFLVARKISQKGTKPQRPFALGFEIGQRNANNAFEYAVEQAVASL